MKETHLIRMNESEYAEYLLRSMTIDMTMDFYYSKECAIKCCEELMCLATDSKTMSYLRKVKNIIENK
jgi:hypothetical protein